MERVGILGGTFDPVHYGHLAIAEEAAWALGLARIYMVPAARQPLKEGQPHADPQQRLEMVRLACAGNALFVPSDIEVRRGPPSFTVDTLRALAEALEHPPEMWFILGSDALTDLPRWHAAAQIVELVRLAVLMRPGMAVDLAPLESHLPGIAARTRVIEGPLLDISSSSLRQRMLAGQPVRYQLPDSVLDYIGEQQLYCPPQQHG
jgi:nicotinate-nucleotide adenylyltransferase